jgi:hypothetical protein
MTEMNTNPMEMTDADLEQLASKLAQDLRSVMARVPDLMLPHATRQRLTGPAVNVPLQAIDAGFAACETQEALAKAIGASDVLYDHRYASIFADLRDEVKTLFDGLDYTMRLARYRVGDATLKVYSYGRMLLKDPANAALRSHIQVMAKTIGRRRRKTAEPMPAPPVPPPVQTAETK